MVGVHCKEGKYAYPAGTRGKLQQPCSPFVVKLFNSLPEAAEVMLVTV